MQVDREQARMLVATVGYDEASQRTGIKPATLRQWSKRYNWKVVPTHKLAVTNVTRPSDALATLLADDSKQTKIGFSRAARKVSDHLAERPAEELTKPATALAAKSWHSVAESVHGWREADPGSSPLNLQVLSQNTVISVGPQTLHDG